jgi:hypothetical protein
VRERADGVGHTYFSRRTNLWATAPAGWLLRLTTLAWLTAAIVLGGCGGDKAELDPLNEATLASLPLPTDTQLLGTVALTYDGTRSLVAYYATSAADGEVLTFYCVELPRFGFSFTGGSVECSGMEVEVPEKVVSFTDADDAQVEVMLAPSNVAELREQLGIQPPAEKSTVFKLFVRRQ